MNDPILHAQKRVSLFDGFYQLGFVTTDLDLALDRLDRLYGLSRFRRRQSSSWMEAAHAWAGEVMLEIIVTTAEAPSLFRDASPAGGETMRLHHHGHRLPDAHAWNHLCRRIEAGGWDIPLRGSVMEGDLNFLYADTRADLGFYSEFVFLTGKAATLYDDVPRN